MRINSRVPKLALTFLVGFGLWELGSLIANVRNFPHSWVVLADLASLVITMAFWESLLVTVGISGLGFIIGALFACVIGIFVALTKSGDLATSGVINFVRSIPSVVFLPLLIASIGSSARTALILTSFVITFKLVTYVVRGIGETDPILIESSRVIGLRGFSKIVYLYLPSTTSIVGTGLRLSATQAFGTVVAAGIVAGTPGLGSALLLAESSANYPRVFSYVFVMGVLGSLIYSLFNRTENKLIRWRVSV